MNRALRFVAVLLFAIAAVAFGASAASGGNGATILTGNFDTYAYFSVDGTSTFYTFTCDEQRVQKPNGSATESATCQLDPGQALPMSAASLDPTFGYISDFFFFGPVAGLVGGTFTYDIHGVLTPSATSTSQRSTRHRRTRTTATDK
jgi:hypothetical protein